MASKCVAEFLTDNPVLSRRYLLSIIYIIYTLIVFTNIVNIGIIVVVKNRR